MAKRRTLYAHTHIEAGDERYAPGDTVPSDLEGIEELEDSGAVSEEAPEVHKQASDEGSAGDAGS